jgi:putative glutamine amidotransferase
VRPLIAVTTTLQPAGSHHTPHVLLGAAYLSALEFFGATGVLLTPAHDAASIAQLVGMADALMLTGGEDVDPARYGEHPHPETDAPNHARDAMEFEALEAALGRGLPVLAICRGHQLLNVALGGTLYQDLPTQFDDSPLLHQQTQPIDQRSHWAEVAEGSRLHGILGTTRLHINSFHHQGIRSLAPGLRASIWAEDGLVEGVETTGRAWVVGVQWHPERHEAEAPFDPLDPDRRIFRAFVEEARRFAGGAAPSRRSEEHDEALDLV